MRPGIVIAGLTRNPVMARHWIPDVETPDLIRGRDDKPRVRDDNCSGQDDNGSGWDDKAATGNPLEVVEQGKPSHLDVGLLRGLQADLLLHELGSGLGIVNILQA